MLVPHQFCCLRKYLRCFKFYYLHVYLCLWGKTAGELEEKKTYLLGAHDTVDKSSHILCYSPKVIVCTTVPLVSGWMPILSCLLSAMGLNFQHNFPLAYCSFWVICLSSLPLGNQLHWVWGGGVAEKEEHRAMKSLFSWSYMTTRKLSAITQGIVALGIPMSACLLCYTQHLINYCFTLMKEVVLSMIQILFTIFLL